MEKLATCFTDHRDPELIEHSVLEMLRQRVYGIALGYEDLNDHDDLMRDPLLALALDKADPEGKNRHRDRDKGKALASSSTLNRLELTPLGANAQSRYKKVVYHPDHFEALLVDLFLDSFNKAPEEIILDFDATDDPVHGEQEGRFFHGYYKCYCYLPLYVTCGDQLLAAKLRTSDRDGADGATELLAYLVERIRTRWAEVNIVVRADSGFCRDGFLDWCETHAIDYVIGLAKNARLNKQIESAMERAKIRRCLTGVATREFVAFPYRTLNSWSRTRRVIGKAESLSKGANPRFIVTNLPEDYASSNDLYEKIYCARGEMENRIKEQQLDLFADRTSSHTMRANQLRLWFSSFAYVLVNTMRRMAPKGTRLARATCGTIRLKLFKLGAHVKISVRRFLVHFSSACPYQDVFKQVWHNLQSCPMRCEAMGLAPPDGPDAASRPLGERGRFVQRT